VYARGTRQHAIFADDLDRLRYLELLHGATRKYLWNVLAFCLMSNHVHLLLETPKPNLGLGMQWLHGKHAMTFNERHGFVGHVFQSRYGAKRIKDDVHLITALRYVENNPVEAGLADWPWSSAAAAPSWLATERLGALLGADPA
jgi:putative transposase